MRRLVITADDYGYATAYDQGILEAARAGAIDSVSAFATREAAGAESLLATGVEVGLHLDLGAAREASRASGAERSQAAQLIGEQIADFTQRFGRPPAYIDGHHHCHARAGLGVVVAELALGHGLPVRSISPRHRRLLRCRGVPTPDLLVGRLAPTEAALPPELTRAGVARLPAGWIVEWMVHPGHPDPSSGSAYDGGRAEDLELLLGWKPPRGIERSDHRRALAAATGSADAAARAG